MAHTSIRLVLTFAALAAVPVAAWGQASWRPDKPVEMIITTAPGGSNDQVARIIQRIWQDEKLVTSPVVILNKPGGNQTLATVYLTQHPGDAHFLLLANPTLVTNHIAGISSLALADVMPIATLLMEHTAISVRADSPVRNFQDLVARLKADPDSMSVGIVARGGVNHLALSQAVKTGGADARKVRAVVFKTNAESMIALVGGHIQLVASSVSAANTQVKTGSARIIAIAAHRRMGGAYAGVPTFKEQGVESWVSNWRAIIGPKGMTPAQIAFWGEALAKMAATDEWRKQLDLQQWDDHFLRGAELARYLESQQVMAKAMMTELGLAKQ